MDDATIEPATIYDLESLSDLLADLFEQEADFKPDRMKQMRALRLLLENPGRGRIFVLRHGGSVVGMINLLVTISTAEGGFALVLEDLVVHREFRGRGFGRRLLDFAVAYAKEKGFVRLSLVLDGDDERGRAFFEKRGFQRSAMTTMRMLLADQAGSPAGGGVGAGAAPAVSSA